MEKLRNLIIFVLLITSTGCSVKMAAYRKTEFDLNKVQPGLSRNYVQSVLGAPVETVEGAPLTDVYYIKKEQTWADYGRAVLYAFLDVGTFGLWEIIGYPLERFLQDDNDVRIEYDSYMNVTKIDK